MSARAAGITSKTSPGPAATTCPRPARAPAQRAPAFGFEAFSEAQTLNGSNVPMSPQRGGGTFRLIRWWGRGCIASLPGGRGRIASLPGARGRIASLPGARGRIASLPGARGRIASLPGARGRIASLPGARGGGGAPPRSGPRAPPRGSRGWKTRTVLRARARASRSGESPGRDMSRSKEMSHLSRNVHF
jgi:hypothetical protein